MCRLSINSPGFVWILAACCVGTLVQPAAALERRPSAIALSGSHLYVANSVTGTLTVIDQQRHKVLGEVDVVEPDPRGVLSDLVAVPGHDVLLAIDDRSHELLALHGAGLETRVVATLSLPASPARVVVEEDGDRAWVSSLWARWLVRIDIAHGSDPVRRPAAEGTQETSTGPSTEVADGGKGTAPQALVRLIPAGRLELPFAPRELLLLPEDRLLVADAFGGALALVRREALRIERTLALDAHNIRGLAVDGDKVVVAHQALENVAHQSAAGTKLGAKVHNRLTVISLVDEGPGDEGPSGEDVSGENAATQPEVISLAVPEAVGAGVGDEAAVGARARGAGDPSAVFVAPSGAVLVLLGGVGQAAVGTNVRAALRRVAAGVRPIDAVFAPAPTVGGFRSASDSESTPESTRELAYVVSAYSEAVSVIDTHRGEFVERIVFGEPGEESVYRRGERLFFDATLSHDGSMSCHSCHSDGFSSSALADTLGDGGLGSPKRAPPLALLPNTGPWSWSGRELDLVVQMTKSIERTMGGRTASSRQLNGLNAFIHQMRPATPVDVARRTVDEDAVARGKAIFERENCDRCHEGPEYSSPGSFDVGLRDEHGRKRFNPPSLRGVGQRSRYFHDHRAASFREVLVRYEHPRGNEVTEEELPDLEAFLRSL